MCELISIHFINKSPFFNEHKTTFKLVYLTNNIYKTITKFHRTFPFVFLNEQSFWETS